MAPRSHEATDVYAAIFNRLNGGAGGGPGIVQALRNRKRRWRVVFRRRRRTLRRRLATLAAHLAAGIQTVVRVVAAAHAAVLGAAASGAGIGSRAIVGGARRVRGTGGVLLGAGASGAAIGYRAVAHVARGAWGTGATVFRAGTFAAGIGYRAVERAARAARGRAAAVVHAGLSRAAIAYRRVPSVARGVRGTGAAVLRAGTSRAATAYRAVPSAARRARGPAAAVGAVFVVVAVAVVGWRSASLEAPVEPAAVAIPEPARAPDPSETRRREASAALLDPALGEDKASALVEQLARDPDEATTAVLLAAARSPSVVVSMASLRALRGRPCGQVSRTLVDGLGHADWQRRAWAAKVLGENGCAAAAPELRRRLARERDQRVRRQLGVALASFGKG